MMPRGRVITRARVFAEYVAVSGLSILLTVAAFSLADGLMRRVFGQPIDAVRDVGNLFVAIAITSCFPYAFIQRTNVSVDFVDKILPSRLLRVFIAIMSVITCLVMIAFAYQFMRHASSMLQSRETSALLMWPKAWFWIPVDLLLWLTAAVQGLVTYVSLCEVFHNGTMEVDLTASEQEAGMI